MTPARSVVAETLDGLAADDPAAQRSRRDLQRIHRAMGTRSIVVGALRDMAASWPPGRSRRLLELGAGDGSLMLGVARALAPSWTAVELTLLDRQALVGRATLDAYAALGWKAIAQVADALDWAASALGLAPAPALAPGSSPAAVTPLAPTSVSAATPTVPHTAAPSGDATATGRDLIIANLFLHHFEGAPLAALLAAAAACGDRFFACEPRRGRLALVASRLVGLIGANAVTREDAVLSVRAGFRGGELSALWTALNGDGWRLQEYSAGLFSHCFRAERIGASGGGGRAGVGAPVTRA